MNHHTAENSNRKPQDRFIYLADQPDLIPQLAEWFYDEWGQNQPNLTQADFEGVLKERLNKDRLPLTLVLLRDSLPIASASLKIQEMETHPQYPHWLGSIYVLPQHRQGGVGSRMVQLSASAARQLGVKDLYLYTRSHEHFYARLGWQPVERTNYRGRHAVIMKRNLSVE
jgi:predicted N-acetyltransferase YhbS